MPLSSILPARPETAADLHETSEELKRLLVHVRRHIHAHPETAFSEHETSAFVREVFDAYGLETSDPLADTGFYVEIEGAEPGPLLGYRADMDALPIPDKKDVSYRSTNEGIAHLCGHDAHTAVALGTALVLHQNREHLQGSVRVFFQPAEESNPSGAPPMIEDGVLEDVREVFAIHVDSSLPVGTFGLRSGPLTSSTDAFRIFVRGRSTGHSARPHEADDTIWVATQIAQSLYQLPGRIQDTRDPAVLTVCRLQGGEALNVIPDTVEMGGTLRCVDPDDRRLLNERIRRIGRKFGEMHDVEVDVEINHGSPPVVNDADLVDAVSRSVRDEFGEEAIHWVPRPSMGGEDFAHYLRHIPGMLIRVGSSDGPASSHPLHDAKFDISEEALPVAVQLMTRVLFDRLSYHAHLRADSTAS